MVSKYYANYMGYWVTWFYSSDKPVLPASPGRGPPSVTSGFSVLAQPAAPASRVGFWCE